MVRAEGVDEEDMMGEVELDTLVIKNVRIKQCERRTRDSRGAEGRQVRRARHEQQASAFELTPGIESIMEQRRI